MDLDLQYEDLDLDSGGKDLDLDLDLNFEELTTSLTIGCLTAALLTFFDDFCVFINRLSFGHL